MTVNLRTYSVADHFLQDAEVYLAVDEPANSLMLGLAYRLRTEPFVYGSQAFFAVVVAGGEPALCALMTPPHRLQLYTRDASPEAALALVAAHLYEQQWPVPGVLAKSGLAEQFAALWTERTGARPSPGMAQRIHWLRKVTHPNYSSGRLRPATDEDLPLLAQWVSEFNREALGQADVQAAEALTRARISSGDLHVWEDSQVVSMVNRARPMKRGITVNLVYTPPEYRRRGYATSCVARFSQSLLDTGWEYCALFTDLANPTSNHIYQSIGYEPVCHMQEINFASTV
jgi:uncharacterized protein